MGYCVMALCEVGGSGGGRLKRFGQAEVLELDVKPPSPYFVKNFFPLGTKDKGREYLL